jgi:cobalamin transport system substrate-binding protein
MGRLTAAVTVAALLLGATACGERSEPTGRTAPLYPVTVQSGDRQLVATAPARRIAVLDGPARSLVRALGAGGRIVGPRPARQIDFTALRQSHPDLIVGSDSIPDSDLSQAAAVTHANVYTIPGTSIQQVERSVTELGRLTGTAVEARALIRRIVAERHLVDTRLAHTPSVTVFVDTGFFTTVSNQSLIGDVLREAHAVNVAAAIAQAGPVDGGQLRRLDPDVYLATSDTGLTLRELRRNPATRRLRAIREGHFALVPAALLVPGPRIGEGIVAVARLLHPDAFR